MFRQILVPTDGSALSETAAAAAVALARGCNAGIVALSVAQPGAFPPGRAGEALAGAAEREQALAAAAQRAARVGRLAEQAGVPHREATAAGPSEHEEIIRVAQELHCDLIFMAAHGQRGVTRMLAGRVPQQVLAWSPLPVMLYRGGSEPA